MEPQSYLIFSLNDSRYGVEALCVQEIFSLPELTPIDEAPRDIVGVINLRGNILPVMDLNIRLGYRQREYCLNDNIIVIEWQKFRIGIIVDRVYEVQAISSNEITTALSYGREMAMNSRQFVKGVAKIGADLAILIDPENLIHYSESIEPLIEDRIKEGQESSNTRDERYIEKSVFCPHATPEEKVIFRERTENLMRSIEAEDLTVMIPLAVIGLNNEYFGLDLKFVREFTDIRKVTPIPCCPAHIVGNMNLRGEIVTLVDVRQVLNLSMNRVETPRKAIVIWIDELVTGVTIDEIFDVMYLHPSQILPVPTAVHSINDEYLRGTAPYREKMMSILDLPKIVQKGDLVVNEEV